MSIVSLLKCLTFMNLSLAMKDVSKLSQSYARWEREAAEVLKAKKIFKDFMRVSTAFKRTWEFSEAEAEDLGAVLLSSKAAFASDKTITHAQIAFLNDLTLFMRKDSGPAWNRISANVVSLSDNTLSSLFLEEDSNDVADLSAQQTMVKIVTSLTGRIDDPTLAPAEVRDLRDDPKCKSIIAKYVKLHAELKVRYKAALKKFVITSGKPLVDVRNAASYLDAMGCNLTPIVFKTKAKVLSDLSGQKGSPFPGKIDEAGKLYLPNGKALVGTMSTGRFWINTEYDPKLDDTFYAKLQDLARGELRTTHMNNTNAKARFGDVKNFASEVERHRKTWLKDLDNKDDIIQVCACITEICFSTKARAGTVGNENKGEPTFGITTLKPPHIRSTSQGLKISYPGKKGTMNHHEIKPISVSNRKVIKIVNSYLEGCPRKDYVFVVNGKHIKGGSRSTKETVNNYLATIGVPITLHKFRHVFATQAAIEMLEASPFTVEKPPTEQEAKAWIIKQAEKIGALLHHRTGSGDKEKVTSNVAFKSYINPMIVREWFTKMGLRQPDKKWLPNFED